MLCSLKLQSLGAVTIGIAEKKKQKYMKAYTDSIFEGFFIHCNHFSLENKEKRSFLPTVRRHDYALEGMHGVQILEKFPSSDVLFSCSCGSHSIPQECKEMSRRPSEENERIGHYTKCDEGRERKKGENVYTRAKFVRARGEGLNRS